MASYSLILNSTPCLTDTSREVCSIDSDRRFDRVVFTRLGDRWPACNLLAEKSLTSLNGDTIYAPLEKSCMDAKLTALIVVLLPPMLSLLLLLLC